MLTLDGRVVGQRMFVPVRVLTGPRAVKLRGLPQRHADVNLLLDTGATGSVVVGSVLRALGDDPSGTTPVRTSMGAVEDRPTYLVDFSIAMIATSGSEVRVRHPVNAIAVQDGIYPAGQHGVLGLDFLHHLMLVYDGPRKRFTLSH